MAHQMDFDGDPLKLFRDAYDMADEYQGVRDEQCERDYQHFHAFVDMSLRDPDRANVFIPKLFSIMMTKAPKEIRASMGKRPYIPFASMDDFENEIAQFQVKMLDELLYKGQFKNEFMLMAFMKMLYGTGFMEVLPHYEDDIRRIVVPEVIQTERGPYPVGYQVNHLRVKRLRFKITTYAPWELRFDPYTRNLYEQGGCRYVIKMRVTSKREIKRLAAQGAYGSDFDVSKLDAKPESYGVENEKDRGAQILENMGMSKPREDRDIGVLFRYESPERYFDVWNDYLLLRDGPNPYDREQGGHGLINLSSCVHNLDPHTSSAFWGNGEAKIQEIMSEVNSDLMNMALDNHNFLNQGITHYAKGRGVVPDQLVHTIGNKIGWDLEPGDHIQNLFHQEFGQPLPSDHYALRGLVDEFQDEIARNWEVNRGEPVEGQHTLGEVSMLKEVGDSSLEWNVVNVETFLTDLGQKALAHMDQFSREQDRVELLGQEDNAELLNMIMTINAERDLANAVGLLNPRDLPGGFDFQFEGSDKVMNQIIRQRNMMTLDERFGNSVWVKENEWLKVLGKAFDLSDEMKKVLHTDEEMAEMMQMQAEAGMGLGQEVADQRHQQEVDFNESQAATKSGKAHSPTQ